MNESPRPRTNRINTARILALATAAMVIPTCAWASDDTSSSAIVTAVKKVQRGGDSQDFSTEARQRHPWFVSIGFYAPNFTGDNTSQTTGGDLAVGFRFPTDNFDFRISLRGQTFSTTDAFGNTADATVSLLSFDALYRMQAFYIGPGISAGQVSGIINGFVAFSGSDATVYSLTAGYDITHRIFVEGRWQTASIDAYKGYSVSVGYRF